MVRIAAILMQVDKVIAYDSRKLKSGENKYHTPALEALAVVHAFGIWRCYLEGNHTVVYTDHNPLLYLMSQPSLNRMQARWVVALQSFSHEWRHKAGKENPADGLSRLEGSTAGSGTVEQDAVMQGSDSRPFCPKLISAIAQHSDSDLFKNFQNGYDTDTALQKMIFKKQVTFWNNMWYYRGKLYVPHTCIQHVLSALHDDMYSGMHLGVKKTLSKVGEKFYWPTWRKDTIQYVSTCEICQKAKPSNVRYGLLSPLPVPDKPFQSITMDFIVSLPVSGKQKYDAILTVVDRLSKFCLLFPCHTDITGLETARLLHSHVFNRYGFPEVIVSDRDPKFTSAFYTEWCRILRIRQNLSTAFHPETDGQSERFNRTLQQVLRCYCSEDHSCWSDVLPAVEFAINAAPNQTTTVAPFMALFGFVPSSPLDIELKGHVFRSPLANDYHVQQAAALKLAK